MGSIHRLAARGLTSVLMWAVAAGCSGVATETSDPGVVCNDGYTAHPHYGQDESGCGPHGGAVDPFQKELDAYFDAYPDGPPSSYVCRDGWRSQAVYQQGACSYTEGWRSCYGRTAGT